MPSLSAFGLLLASVIGAAHGPCRCLCMYGMQPDPSRYRSVFVGRVLHWGPPPASVRTPLVDSMRPFVWTATLVVEQAWKGATADTVRLVIVAGGDCAPDGRPGERWLVFTAQRRGEEVIEDCSRSAPLTTRQAQSDVRFLERTANPAGCPLTGASCRQTRRRSA
jgi:hypothetical protein